MAKGQVFSIANQTAILRTTQANTEKQSLALLNPNDGVVYIAIDRRADSSLSGWDWKLPSQSYGVFPGPWTSVGLYYLDQSGAGVAGEFNLYDVDTQLYIPDIHSVGRALQARQNTLDIAQGTLPPNPSIGVLRAWADNSSNGFNLLNSAGVNERVAWDNLANVQQGVGLVTKLQLNGVASALQANAITAAVNSWAHVSQQFLFTVDQASSFVEVGVLYSGFITNPNATWGLIQFGLGLDESAAGSGIAEWIGNVNCIPNVNSYFEIVGKYYATGLAAGTHSLIVDAFYQGTNLQVTCSPGSAGHTFRAMAVEFKL